MDGSQGGGGPKNSNGMGTGVTGASDNFDTDYGDDSGGNGEIIMTTERPVDIVEFECHAEWKGTLKMQDVNYYQVQCPISDSVHATCTIHVIIFL